MNTPIKLVVIDNHTLGYLIPGTDNAGIIWPSGLRGSPWNTLTGSVNVKYCDVKLASEQDFKDFNVSFKGFDNCYKGIYTTQEYEYQK